MDKPSPFHKRKLRPEEKQVWRRVTKTVTPRRAKSAKPVPSRQDFAAMMRLPSEAPLTLRGLPGALDINQDKKTRRGRVEIDAKIDLHDMTQAEARPALTRAIIRAANRNYKCILVITGKGARLDGVLRRNFPHWIAAPDVRPLIATYAQAHIRHGGAGAWYVFLKTGPSR